MQARLGYVSVPGRGANDRLLCAVADRLSRDGLRVAGTVQEARERPGRALCDMDLKVMPDGPTLRISEERGDLARGCRLDASVLEEAVMLVTERLPQAEVLVVNKFGKRESEGGGFVTVIAAAIEAGIPVIVGVNALNLTAFLSFAGDLATALPGEAAAIRSWVADAVGSARLEVAC